jgi:adenosylmethionine-8-amino-7-oxononanoate aminotransferase
MALQYWQQRGQPRRRKLIALEHAYHGDTLGAMAVSARSPFTAAFDWMLPPVERVPSDNLAPLERLLSEQGPRVAALIMEPLLQAAGGMFVQPAEFLRGVHRLCREHGVLLIADEVLTGFGRTGTMFASNGAGDGASPDIVCLSKGLTAGFMPLAATACTEEIFSAFLSSDRRQTLFHGHSFTGNPLGCAAALASLDIFATEPVFERIDAIARHHAARLSRLRSHPLVADVRQAGTVGIIELKQTDSGYLAAIGPRIQSLCLERGVALRPLGSVVYVLPPYCITPDELGGVWDAIEFSLDSIGATTL